MNKTGSAAKVKLNSFDDLFGDGQPQAGIEQVQEIALSELHEFKGHPFKVLDDEKMQETVESVREHGVLMPGIARPRAEGGYEIIAGHRRRHACELVGLDTMPMFIRNYTDDGGQQYSKRRYSSKRKSEGISYEIRSHEASGKQSRWTYAGRTGRSCRRECKNCSKIYMDFTIIGTVA